MYLNELIKELINMADIYDADTTKVAFKSHDNTAGEVQAVINSVSELSDDDLEAIEMETRGMVGDKDYKESVKDVRIILS